MSLTDNRNDPRLQETDPSTGMQKAYLVLSEEERAKGFVRPLRRSYVHVGPSGPKYPLRDLTEEEAEIWGSPDRSKQYVKYETYPEGSEGSSLGRFWTQEQLDKVGVGCGAVTRMGLALCETAARNPHFYSDTWCVGCNDHLPIEEFVWDEDGQRLGE